MGIYNDLIFTEALDQVIAICSTKSTDEIADRLEKIAASPDLALSVMGLLVMKLKGADLSGTTGVELANVMPTIADLILPPGVQI